MKRAYIKIQGLQGKKEIPFDSLVKFAEARERGELFSGNISFGEIGTALYWNGDAGDIKNFFFEEDGADVEPIAENDKYAKDKEEYANEIKKRISIPPIQRSELLAPFKLYFFHWSGLTRKEPPQEALDEAKKVQLKFFTDNPNIAFCPPSQFKEIFQKYLGDKKTFSLADRFTTR